MKTLLISLFTTLNIYALVDYSDPSEYASPKVTPTRNIQKAAPINNSRATAPKSMSQNYLEFQTSFNNFKFTNNERSGKIDSVVLDGRINTDYDVFLKFELPFYSGRFSNDMTAVSNAQGNPLFILGLNWFEYGSAADALTIDFHGGARFKGSSEFASGRTDKIVGVETSKRFHNFGLSLGYDLQLSGTSPNDGEEDIGNITTLNTTLGWLVSHDIKFLLRAASVRINESSDRGKTYRLQNSIRYAYVEPELILTLGSVVDLSLKGLFQTRRPKAEDLSSRARLWSQKGLYGNTLSAGLNFSI